MVELLVQSEPVSYLVFPDIREFTANSGENMNNWAGFLSLSKLIQCFAENFSKVDNREYILKSRVFCAGNLGIFENHIFYSNFVSTKKKIGHSILFHYLSREGRK